MTRHLVCAALLLAAAPLSAQVRTDALRDRIAERIAQVPNAVVGVAYRRLGATSALSIAGDSIFHAASTMKVPVMIEVFRRVQAGALDLDQPILLVNQFGSIVDGSPYTLDAGSDSDSALYLRVGERVPLRELVERMIVRSSNLATNAVIALVGAERANAGARALGARTINVRRGVEDGKAFARGLNNTTSALDLAALLEAIALQRAGTAEGCAEMLGILSRQELNDEIPAGLPPGTTVAHKTGQITGVLHDAALISPEGRTPYVLVVLTRGIPDERIARALIADISRMVYEFDGTTK